MPTMSAGADDLVPCPHCGRTFNETSAERHIPKCKDIKGKVRASVWWVLSWCVAVLDSPALSLLCSPPASCVAQVVLPCLGAVAGALSADALRVSPSAVATAKSAAAGTVPDGAELLCVLATWCARNSVTGGEMEQYRTCNRCVRVVPLIRSRGLHAVLCAQQTVHGAQCRCPLFLTCNAAAAHGFQPLQCCVRRVIRAWTVHWAVPQDHAQQRSLVFVALRHRTHNS